MNLRKGGNMIELKTINFENVPSALEMAERYRLLSEPDEAESICLDILEIDPNNQDAIITLLLALTDKFSSSGLVPSYDGAKSLLDRLATSYGKSYYRGIIFERRAKYHLRQQGPGSGTTAYQWFQEALNAYGEALKDNDAENQKAILRWNSCARIINNNPEVKPDDQSQGEMLIDAYD